jgi:hypothetical protein
LDKKNTTPHFIAALHSTKVNIKYKKKGKKLDFPVKNTIIKSFAYLISLENLSFT